MLFSLSTEMFKHILIFLCNNFRKYNIFSVYLNYFGSKCSHRICFSLGHPEYTPEYVCIFRNEH